MEEQDTLSRSDANQPAVADQDAHEMAHPHASKRLVWGVVALCGMVALVGIWSQWGEDIKDVCTSGGDTGACAVEFDDPPSMDDVQFEAIEQNGSAR